MTTRAKWILRRVSRMVSATSIPSMFKMDSQTTGDMCYEREFLLLLLSILILREDHLKRLFSMIEKLIRSKKGNGGIILPKTASFEDAKVEVKEKGESKNSAGRLEYTYAGHAVGGADIMVTKAEPEKFPYDNTKEAGKKGEKTAYVKGNTIVMLVIIVLVCAALALIGRYVSDNSFVIKTKVDRKRNKPDPRYTINRKSKKIRSRK